MPWPRIRRWFGAPPPDPLGLRDPGLTNDPRRWPRYPERPPDPPRLMDGHVTPHLTLAELACQDGTPYPIDRWPDRAQRIGAGFEHVRAAIGRPIEIRSAFRTPEHNQRHAGARRSFHLVGLALDLAVPDGWLLDVFAAAIHRVADVATLGAVFTYPGRGFVHLDWRDRISGRLLTREY